MRCTPDKHADPMCYGRAQHPRPAIVILQSHWTPQSRGTELARSADPRVPPAIRTKGLTAAAEIAAFLRAIRRTREIAATEPLASVLSTEIHPGTQVVPMPHLRSGSAKPPIAQVIPRALRPWAPIQIVCSTSVCECAVSTGCALQKLDDQERPTRSSSLHLGTGAAA